MLCFFGTTDWLMAIWPAGTLDTLGTLCILLRESTTAVDRLEMCFTLDGVELAEMLFICCVVVAWEGTTLRLLVPPADSLLLGAGCGCKCCCCCWLLKEGCLGVVVCC